MAELHADRGWDGRMGSGSARKVRERNPLDAKVRALQAQVARLEHELHTAHPILDVQGKVVGPLGLNLEHATRS